MTRWIIFVVHEKNRAAVLHHITQPFRMTMKYVLLLSATLLLTSCDWFKQKTKETVNKSGEIVAKTGAEFANGVSKGIEKTFEHAVVISGPLQQAGLSTGKIIINSTDSSIDNILTVYMIFGARIDRPVTLKVFSEAGQEYGRVTRQVQGQANEARYVDFVFDRRTNIDGKGKLSFE